MGWATSKSREFINGLRDRRLVTWVPEAGDGKKMYSVIDSQLQGEWKRGEKNPGDKK
jgi:hypothetical protein